ncbi:MAG: type I-E CRISPR-associated protein Cas7/Cse4/CasC [Holophaga sp.]
MQRFLQLHLLTSYPPANLNRDDLGRPKTAILGGALRLRISSQSLKRAWRTSDVFRSQMEGHIGTRTKRLGVEIHEILVNQGIAKKEALEWACAIAAKFGKPKKGDDKNPLGPLEIEQLAHISPEERKAVDDLLARLVSKKRGPTEEELNLLRKNQEGADIALFGRMLAAEPEFNVEGAVQVAHAVTVHKIQVEDDFFTAVDDLNAGTDDVGSAHMGETEFGAGLFYLYLCVDRELLVENLGGSRGLADRALKALLESAATVAPTGKQNSFGSRAYASYILAELGDRQPRNLSVAFLKPIQDTDLLGKTITCLTTTRHNLDKVYGPCWSEEACLDATQGLGSLAELKAFVVKD